jgi:hypothetical protein
MKKNILEVRKFYKLDLGYELFKILIQNVQELVY